MSSSTTETKDAHERWGQSNAGLLSKPQMHIEHVRNTISSDIIKLERLCAFAGAALLTAVKQEELSMIQTKFKHLAKPSTLHGKINRGLIYFLLINEIRFESRTVYLK